MDGVNTTENLRAWMLGCPSIETTNRFGVDWLGKNAVEYSLFAAPSSIKYSQDILGNIYMASKQELNYTFVAKFPFSQDILQNLDNLGFFADIQNWIYRQNKQKSFPEIAEGSVISIMPTLSPYVHQGDDGTGWYQISLKIIYRPNN